jgi:acyl-CoA dehydrogenase
VLARLPDAPPGTKGISLFLVPKRLPDADGNAGVANSSRSCRWNTSWACMARPTCVMQYDGATGWLVGEPMAAWPRCSP